MDKLSDVDSKDGFDEGNPWNYHDAANKEEAEDLQNKKEFAEDTEDEVVNIDYDLDYVNLDVDAADENAEQNDKVEVKIPSNEQDAVEGEAPNNEMDSDRDGKVGVESPEGRRLIVEPIRIISALQEVGPIPRDAIRRLGRLTPNTTTRKRNVRSIER